MSICYNYKHLGPWNYLGAKQNKEWKKCTEIWSDWSSFSSMSFSRWSISGKVWLIIYFYTQILCQLNVESRNLMFFENLWYRVWWNYYNI